MRNINKVLQQAIPSTNHRSHRGSTKSDIWLNVMLTNLYIYQNRKKGNSGNLDITDQMQGDDK